ncbi:hypothetical protein L7F22_018067 [Adiantum nelumboides]|nr:hypothetical protein [Adiantum nelumboides]
MSHYNVRIPKRPRGTQRMARVNEGGIGSQESVPLREPSGLGGHKTAFEIQLNAELGFMELLQEDGWGGSLSEGQSIENIGLSQSAIPLHLSVAPGVSFIPPRPPPTSFSPLIPQGFRPPRMGPAPRMGVSMTIPTLNVRPSLLSTVSATVPLRPPVTSSTESTKGAKRSRVAIPVWDETATTILLKHYEDRWSHVNKGNLRPKNWEAVSLQLNNEISGTFTPEQVKNRIDTLRKKYKKEKTKTTTTGGMDDVDVAELLLVLLLNWHLVSPSEEDSDHCPNEAMFELEIDEMIETIMDSERLIYDDMKSEADTLLYDGVRVSRLKALLILLNMQAKFERSDTSIRALFR